MPSLREYVLTLKKYNPKVQDRMLKIYLLKAGWPIVDIEKEFSTPHPDPIPPVAEPAVVQINTIASNSNAHDTPKITQEVEVAALEIEPEHKVEQVPPPVIPTDIPKVQISPTPVETDTEIPTLVDVSVPMPSRMKTTSTVKSEKLPIIDGYLDKNTFGTSSGIGLNARGPVASSASILAALAGNPRVAEPTPPVLSGSSSARTPDQETIIASSSSRDHFDRPQMSDAKPFIPIPTIMPGQQTSNPKVKMPSSIETTTGVPKKKSGKKIGIWIFILLFLGLLVFGYMRFAHGVYVFVNAPIDKNNIVSYISSSIAKVDSAEYTSNISLRMMPIEPGVESLDAIMSKLKPLTRDSLISTSTASSTSTSVRDFLASFPVDGIIDLQVQGLYRKEVQDIRKNDSKWHVIGNYSGEGLAAKFDVESILKKNITYIRAKAFPEMFFDINAIRDKWVSIDDSDMDSVASALPWLGLLSYGNMVDLDTVSSSTSTKSDFRIFDIPNPRPANFNKQVDRLLSLANEEKVLEVIGDPQKVIQRGSSWYMPQRVRYSYQLQPNLPRFIAFIERSNTVMQDEFGTSSILFLSGEERQKLLSKEFANFFNYFVSNGYFKLTIDKSGALVDISTSLKLVSDEKQALITTDISLDNINRNVNIEEPKPDMTFTDAYVLISGQSKELLQLKRQIKTVEAIRAQIASYQNQYGEVPDTLNGMVLPNLPFATSSYAYKKNSKTSYLLSYQIVLPPLPPQFYEMPLSLIGFDSSTAASSGTDLSMQYLKFVNGKNTASEKTLSIEADLSKRLDSDRDRITNSLEQYIGTNITKKDTDDDGVDDYEELQKGGNPTGAGSWVGARE